MYVPALCAGGAGCAECPIVPEAVGGGIQYRTEKILMVHRNINAAQLMIIEQKTAMLHRKHLHCRGTSMVDFHTDTADITVIAGWRSG